MSSNRNIIFLFLLGSLFSAFLSAHAAGFVPVRNFDRTTYHGGAQNWQTIQDSVGRLYVANGDAMLAFDGQRWSRHFLPNYTPVRSLLYDRATERIYAGGSDVFGYFSPDSLTGSLVFTSLSDGLANIHPPLAEVWAITRADGRIWFQSDFHIIELDGDNIRAFTPGGRISRLCNVGDRILLAMEDGRVLRFSNGSTVPLPGMEALRDKKIMAILPFGPDGHLLLATQLDGLYIYDGHHAVPFDCDINAFLKQNRLFSAASRGDTYVFGTVDRGAVIRNFKTGRTDYINKETGLQNNTVLHIDFDRDSHLWLSLDNGLSYALCNTAVRSLTGPLNPIGTGYAALVDGDIAYLGTNQGLYSAPFPFVPSPAPMDFRQLVKGQVWSITRSGSTIFVASDAGVYAREGNSPLTRVDGPGGAAMVRTIPGAPGLALASTYRRFHMLERVGGRWTDRGEIPGYDDIAGEFVIDRHGDIWLAHWRKGVYRLRFDPASRRFTESELLTTDRGLPDISNISVSIYNGEAVFSTVGGLYRYDRHSGRFVRDNSLMRLFPRSPGQSLRVLSDSLMALVGPNGAEIASMDRNGRFSVDSTSYMRFQGNLLVGYTRLAMMPDRSLLISTQDGFGHLSPPGHVSARGHSAPFVNAVIANADSIIYRAPLDSAAEHRLLSLPYELNTLRFDFAYPDFSSPDAVEFCSFLEGYDDDWSSYGTDAYREYTRLPEGNYTLRLRARDMATGTVSETEFALRIQPPWYRTMAARVVYLLIILAMVVLLLWLIRRYADAARHKLEQRQILELEDVRKKAEQESLLKDYEIATLKSEQLEQDIRHKSQELSSTAMNLVRKNEILRDISAKISRIRELSATDDGLPAARRLLGKIQDMIEDSIGHDDDWEVFTRNFDTVYVDYTKRLIERHPNLSPSDKRLCCYIRMGLSSKEIAPLVNISYKSVEMARYRLRKKMDLASDASLTAYLDSI